MTASMNLRVGLIGLLVAALHVALIAAVARFEPRHPPAPEALAIALLVTQPPPEPPEVVPAPAPPQPQPLPAPIQAPPLPAPAPSAPAPILPPPSPVVSPAPPPPRPARPVPSQPAPAAAARPPQATSAPTTEAQPHAVTHSATTGIPMSEPANVREPPDSPPTATSQPVPEAPQSQTASTAGTPQRAAPATEKDDSANDGVRASRRPSGPRQNARWSGNAPEWNCPPSLRGRRLEAIIEAYIDEQGRVTEARVLSQSRHRAFDAFAVDAIKKAKFDPVIEDGRPVASWREQPMSIECE